MLCLKFRLVFILLLLLLLLLEMPIAILDEVLQNKFRILWSIEYTSVLEE